MSHFGLLLPHFGESANAERIVVGARLAESAGFDAVWVRDHLIFSPHSEFEKPDANFLEALTVLTAVGASTDRILLGTAALIPFRHPIQTALVVSTMTQFFGPRVILGFGCGNARREFDAIGLGDVSRIDLVVTHVRIMRKLWTEPHVSWHDENLNFDDVTLEPRPTGEKVPVLYCGSSPRGARIGAVAPFDGWMPGRIPLETLRVRVASIEAISSAEEGRTGGRAVIGIVPVTSLASSREEALSEVNLPGLLDTANRARFWVKPSSGRFETADDLAGMLLCGTPDDVTEQTIQLLEAGVDHVVFDFRMSFGRWEEQISVLAREVISNLRAWPQQGRAALTPGS